MSVIHGKLFALEAFEKEREARTLKKNPAFCVIMDKLLLLTI